WRIHIGTSTGNTGRNKRDEKSLTLMLFAQIILLTIFTLSQAGQKFYLTYSFYQPKTSSQGALESLIFNFVLLLTYGLNCIAFYLFTITGTIFRATLFKLLKDGIQHLNCFH
ncbi:unnamed protein product, partial [Rotaria magnacalcarata]